MNRTYNELVTLKLMIICIDTSTTAGSDSFINSNVAPPKLSVAGPEPTTPTTKPLYYDFRNIDSEFEQAFKYTHTCTTKKSINRF